MVSQLEEIVTKVRIEVAKQSEQIKSLDDKVDEISSGVKEIRNSLIGETTKTNKWHRSLITRIVAILIAGSLGGAGATTAIKAYAQKAPKPTITITQPIDTYKGIGNSE